MTALLSLLLVLAVAGLASWSTRAATLRTRTTDDGRVVTLVTHSLHDHLLVGPLPLGERLVLDVADAVVARDAFLMLLEGIDPRERLAGVVDHSWTRAARR